MSPQTLDDDRLPDLPHWFYMLGLDQPDQCAAGLAQAAVDDPFRIISFVSIAVDGFGVHLGSLIDLLAEYEPKLRAVLTMAAAALPFVDVTEHLPELTQDDVDTLPQWLREIDKLACTGFMRRYDYANRSYSSYLIEVRLADGQTATGRVVIRRGDPDQVVGFATLDCPLREATRFFRDRGTGGVKRTFRHVKPETASKAVLQAVVGHLSNDDPVTDGDPSAWPRNMLTLVVMLRPALRSLAE